MQNTKYKTPILLSGDSNFEEVPMYLSFNLPLQGGGRYAANATPGRCPGLT